jgi:hypothetical protein
MSAMSDAWTTPAVEINSVGSDSTGHQATVLPHMIALTGSQNAQTISHRPRWMIARGLPSQSAIPTGCSFPQCERLVTFGTLH